MWKKPWMNKNIYLFFIIYIFIIIIIFCCCNLFQAKMQL